MHDLVFDQNADVSVVNNNIINCHKIQAITTTQTNMRDNDIKTLTMLIPDPIGVVYNHNNNTNIHEGR